MRADRARRLATIVACAFPLLFAAAFTYRYGYSPLVVALHVVEVALTCVVLFVLFRVLVNALGEKHAALARLVLALSGATITSLYLLVLVVSTVTNEAWGWSVSIDLARTYLQYLPSIVGNLPVSTGLIALGIAALVAALAGIYVIW